MSGRAYLMKLTENEKKIIQLEVKIRQIWLEKTALQATVDKSLKGERNVLRDNLNSCSPH